VVRARGPCHAAAQALVRYESFVAQRKTASELPELLLADAGAWRTWLEENHASSDGVWLRLAKKGTVEPTRLGYGEALEHALCFGWIDGQVRRFDEATFKQRFTPRRARSVWSKNNVAKVERLIAEGRMAAAGLAAFESARVDGRLERAYPGQASIEVPEDLTTALKEHPPARAAFEKLSSQNRYAVLLRIHQATRPQTRAARIRRFVDMLARGETPHPQGPSTCG
jgi:uncharacterized protein YdeI (YjbR/CyaY-like superfamily)